MINSSREKWVFFTWPCCHVLRGWVFLVHNEERAAPPYPEPPSRLAQMHIHAAGCFTIRRSHIDKTHTHTHTNTHTEREREREREREERERYHPYCFLEKIFSCIVEQHLAARKVSPGGILVCQMESSTRLDTMTLQSLNRVTQSRSHVSFLHGSTVGSDRVVPRRRSVHRFAFYALNKNTTYP